MTLEKLKEKRANLVAQRDQHLANLNVTSGAIAMCDELIAEQEAETDAVKIAVAQSVAGELTKMQAEIKSGVAAAVKDARGRRAL